jgi:hypothetical protein
MTSLAELRKRLMTDPEVRGEYERLGPVYELVGAMAEADEGTAALCSPPP